MRKIRVLTPAACACFAAHVAFAQPAVPTDPAESFGPPAPTSTAGSPRTGPPADTESLPLVASAPPAGPGAQETIDPATHAPGWLRTGGALVAVIALALLMKFALSRATRGGGALGAMMGAGGRAPSGLLSVLGRYPVGRGQTLVLLKVDRRVLLLSQTQAGFATLSEITDPEDVASILVGARDDEGTSIASRFGALLSRFERDPSIAGAEVELKQTPLAPPTPPTGPTGPITSIGPTTHTRSSALSRPGRDPMGALRRRLEGLREVDG